MAMHCALQTLAYLDSQRDRGIRFNSADSGTPVCFYDSSSKRDPKDSHAQYGWVIMMFGGPVMWSAKKHNHSGRSTTDDEYMAMAHASNAVLWIRSLLDEMGFGALVSSPTLMLGDNLQATSLARDDRLTQANRYFRREYHFSKECYESGDTCPRKVPGSENISDLLTKSLGPQTFNHLVPRFTGYQHLGQLPGAPPQ